MNKREKLFSIKRTLDELKIPATIVFCSSKGPEIPYQESVLDQKYIISFSCSGRGLLYDNDIVKKALKENLGRITDSIQYLAQQALYQAEKDALEEAEGNLVNIKREIRQDDKS